MNTNQAIEILAFNKKPLKKKFKTVKAYMAAYHKYRNAQLALGLPTCTLYTRRNKVGVNPSHQGTTHLVRRTLDGVVGSLNQEGA